MKGSQALRTKRTGPHFFDGPAPPLLGAALLAFSALAVAATDAELEAAREQLARDWYYTEVIIFQRPEVMEYLSEEALTSDAAGGFPAATQAFLPAPAERASAARYSGDAGAEGDADGYCLAFPEMQAPQALTAAPEDTAAAPGEGARAADAGPLAGNEDLDGDQVDATLPPPAATPRLAPDPLLDYLNTLAEFETTLEESSLSLLPGERLQLGAEASRINRDRRFQVLWHGGWVQALPARDAPLPLLIQAGHRADGVHQLEGTIDVTLGRYLHFHTRLFYHEPLQGESPVPAPIAPAPGGDAQPEDTQAETIPAAMVAALETQQPRFMVLEERRRMRSEELHYLDHPKLGVLVRIEPVDLPEALVDAYLALEESME